MIGHDLSAKRRELHAFSKITFHVINREVTVSEDASLCLSFKAPETREN